MDWNGNVDMPFPAQRDQDGDGLLSLAQGGADPDDTRFDTDGDSLSDAYELQNGLDPEQIDTDQDGLDDARELALQTNPLHSDTDNDGLTDYVEAEQGWLISYGFADNGDPLVTRVWSSPLTADIDDDALSDLKEMTFGFNPWVPTDPSIIKDIIRFDNMTINEDKTPSVLLRFEESAEASVFADSSGANHTAVCERASGSCPSIDINGRYGQGLFFDGISDYVSTTLRIDTPLSGFTVATWFFLMQPGMQSTLISQQDSPQSWLTVQPDGRVTTGIGNNNYTSNGTVMPGQWHHLAATSDGTQLKLYLNGVLDRVIDNGSISVTAGDMLLGVDKNLTPPPFFGLMDEVVVVEAGLTAAEIGDVMNGRYNRNDLIVTPGASLTYEATITNTHPLQESDGFLVGSTHYETPSIAHPTLALRFEEEDLITSFANSSGESTTLICPAGGTCPTVVASGKYGDAVQFDGLDDALDLPPYLFGESLAYSLAFWVRVASLPASGERAYILDTDSIDSGALSIYLDDAGALWIAQKNSNPGPQSASFDFASNLNTWVHVALGVSVSSDNVRIYIDGILDSNISYTGIPDIDIGPGRIGNSVAGTAPFNGRLDEFVFYRSWSGITTSNVTDVYDGTYIILGANELYPEMLFEFNELPLPKQQFVNRVTEGKVTTCATVSSCPTLTTNGRFGHALSLDGTDYLTLTHVIDPAQTNFTVASWFKVSDLGQNRIILNQLDGSGTGRTWLGVQSTNELYTYLGGSNLLSPPDVTLNQWHHSAVTYDGTTLRLYLDGQLVNSEDRVLEASDGDLFIGQHKSGSNQFSGLLDEMIVVPSLVDAAGIQTLMNSTWPILSADTTFIPFNVPANTGLTVNGSVQVSPDAVSGQQRFAEEVEVALQFAESIPYPIFDDNAADLIYFAPFEEVPGSTVFDNLITTSNTVCQHADFCPAAGLRGKVDRAVFFDGQNDFLRANDLWNPFYETGTIAVWVKADRGTIVDTLFVGGLELDINRFLITIYDDNLDTNTRYNLPFTIPENEWTHLVAVFDRDSGVATVYANGSEIASLNTGFDNSDPDQRLEPFAPLIGINTGKTDRLHGYVDDLRLYDVPLTAAEAQALYENSVPQLRFEFDEGSDATTFADAAINGYVGVPTSQLCADWTLNRLQINSLTTVPSAVSLELDEERVGYVSDVTAGLGYDLSNSSPLCDQRSLSVGLVLTGGITVSLGTAVLSSVLSGQVTQTFSIGGDSIDLSWTVAANPVVQPNPTPGTDGQIGNTALFDGRGFIEIEGTGVPGDALGALTDSLTIMGWINPADSNAAQRILSAGRDFSDNGYGVRLRPNNRLSLQLFGVQTYNSSAVVASNVWQHIAVVLDSSYDAHFYIDGVLVDTVPGSSPALANTDDPFFVGAKTDTGGNMHQFFTGQIDELAVYSRSLSTAEIYSIFLRELRWYRDHSNTLITVDNDQPTLSLLTTHPYRPNGYIQLAVSANDPTSAIAFVEMGLKAPGQSGFTWEMASRCADDFGNNTVWCPSFDSTQWGHGGVYEIQFRTADSVGNETISQLYYLSVDDTPPIASSGYTGVFLIPANNNVAALSWSLPLSGTISDPDISSGVPGSGIYTDTVILSIIDGQGKELGGNPQTAVISGGLWSVNYQIAGERPLGMYTLTLSLEDRVGNQASLPVGTIRLDEQPPTVIAFEELLPPYIISQTVALTGVITDQIGMAGVANVSARLNPAFDYPMAYLPFEEEPGRGRFADVGGRGLDAICQGDCTVSSSGQGINGRGLHFDQNDGAVTILDDGLLDFAADQDFTIALWARIDESRMNRYQAFLFDNHASGQPGYYMFYYGTTSGQHGHINVWRSDGTNGASLTSSQVISDGEYHHLVLRKQGNVLSLFIDGQFDNSVVDVATGNMDNNVNFTLGINHPTPNFAGEMDELLVYDRALALVEIADLAQPKAQPTLTATGTLSTTWSYPIPSGLENFYQIDLWAGDTFSNTSRTSTVWRGAIDMVAPRITATAQYIGGGSAAQTEVIFDVDDLEIDVSSLVHPCFNFQVTKTLRSEPSVTEQLAATCRLPDHEADPLTVSACDLAGHCTTVTINAASTPKVDSVAILDPVDKKLFGPPAATTVSGGAYDEDLINNLTVYVDGTLLDTIVPGVNVTDTTWSTTWTPTLTGTYTLVVVMEDILTNVLTDTIQVTVATANPTAVSLQMISGETTGSWPLRFLLLVVGILVILTGALALRRRDRCV